MYTMDESGTIYLVSNDYAINYLKGKTCHKVQKYP